MLTISFVKLFTLVQKFSDIWFLSHTSWLTLLSHSTVVLFLHWMFLWSYEASLNFCPSRWLFYCAWIQGRILAVYLSFSKLWRICLSFNQSSYFQINFIFRTALDYRKIENVVQLSCTPYSFPYYFLINNLPYYSTFV